MIDGKKIKEAAKKYASEKPIIINCGYMMGFIKGIDWFLDNLWHDAKEEPKATPKENDGYVFRSKIVWLLALTDDDDIAMMYSTHENGYKGDFWLFHDLRGYEYDPFDGEIKKWLYIDDLVQKKGAEHEK